MIAVATTSSQALWYLARGTGLVSLVLLTIVMVLGIVQVQRWAPPGWPRFVAALLHRNASLLVVVFLVVHIASSVIDGFAGISWFAAVLPGATNYRPIWVGLGACAFDLLLALVATSLLRARIDHRTWRTIHWLAYLSWPIAFAHGLGTGTDGRLGWVQVLDAACLVAVLAAVAWRLAIGWNLEPAARVAGAFGSAIVVIGLVSFAAVGPTRVGWAKRAGTPARLLGHAAIGATPTTVAGSSAVGLPAVPFSTQLSGTEVQHGSTTSTVDIRAQFPAGSPVTDTLEVILHGRALAGGGLHLRDGTLTIGAGAQQATGRVTALAGPRILATITLPDGARADIDVVLAVDHRSGVVSGSIRAAAA